MKILERIKNLFRKEGNITDGYPALKESASQFNDALLDEQAKKIAELTKENEDLKSWHEMQNRGIALSNIAFRDEKKRLGKEISKLNGIIHDKNAILADVAEELRLTKIREKNLAELGLKYVGENEKLKKELADKTELVKIVRNSSKEYCDYGVAANEFIKELAHLYVLASNNGIINIEMLERCKNYQTYGFPANCNRETKKEINDIARGKKNKKPRIPTPEEPKYDSIIERCKRLGIELHYHDGKVPTYTNAFGDEVPVYGLRGIFAICTDEEYKSLFKK